MEQCPRAVRLFSRNLYIDESYKFKLTLKVALLVVIGTAALCLSFYEGIDREIGAAYPAALEGIRHVRTAALEGFLLHEGVMIVLVGAAATLFTLVMSHRIAGPLWRVEQTARAIGSGDLTRKVNFRKKDEIKALADQVNKMTTGLRARLDDINATHAQMRQRIETLKDQVDKGGFLTDESLKLTREILDTSKDIVSKLSEIKTR